MYNKDSVHASAKSKILHFYIYYNLCIKRLTNISEARSFDRIVEGGDRHSLSTPMHD